MQFRFWRTTRRREFEEDFERSGARPKRRESGHQLREVAPAGAEATRRREADSEWLWWLSSPMRGGALSGREARVGRGWSLDELDELDEPSSPPAA
jgi:hypothetical protein